MPTQLITIEHHILEQERAYPEATGVFSNLLYDVALAAKIVAREIQRAGLGSILGKTGTVNIQGEQQLKFDVFANDAFINMNSFTGRVGIMASEELDDLVVPTDAMRSGKYVLIFDPIDGSSNIDVNVSVGTVFSVYRRKTPVGTNGTHADCLQPGKEMVAAGYIIYGSSTMMVYSTGNGVHGFTLEPTLGEFLLSHPDIQIPKTPKYYSTNESYTKYWSAGMKKYTDYLRGLDSQKLPYKLSARYVGSLVSDFHRNLLQGGVFYYPLLYKDLDNPKPKLRLLYEAAPLAFIVRGAGGYASDGKQSILDIQPESVHQRVPLFIGNRDLVEKAEEYIRNYG